MTVDRRWVGVRSNSTKLAIEGPVLPMGRAQRATCTDASPILTRDRQSQDAEYSAEPTQSRGAIQMRVIL